MRATVASGLRLRTQPQPLGWQVGATLALAVVVVAWSAVEIAGVLGRVSLGSSGKFYALTASLPAALGLAMILAREKLPPAFGLALAWTLIFGIAIAGVPYATTSLSYALTPAVIAVSTLTLRRWPAFGVLLLFAITGASGSLIVLFHAPTGTVTYLVLASLWIGVVIAYITGDRRAAVRLWPGAVVILAFLVATILQMALSESFSAGLSSFRVSGLYMTVVLLLAYAPWHTVTYERVAKGIVVVALLVGAYATFRLIVGPAAQERAALSTTIYSFVNGKLKLAGSLGSAAALGAWTAALMPYCFAIALALRDRWRVIALTAFGLCGVGMFGSQLRSALVAVTIGLVTVLILYQPARAFRHLRVGATIAAIAIVLGSGVGGIIATGGGEKGHSYQSITQPSRDLSVSDRLFKWKEAIRDLRGKPFGFGVGTATLSTSISDHGSPATRFRLNIGAYSIDSGYLKIALEQGYYLMALFVAALVLTFGGIARAGVTLTDRRRAGVALGAAGTLAAFTVLLLTDAFQDGLQALAIWIVIGLGAVEVSRRGATSGPAAE